MTTFDQHVKKKIFHENESQHFLWTNIFKHMKTNANFLKIWKKGGIVIVKSNE